MSDEEDDNISTIVEDENKNDDNSFNLGGFIKKQEDDSKTETKKTDTSKTKSVDEKDKIDFIEKYFHGNLLAFFIVLILMMIIGLEIFYIIFRIVRD